MEETLKKIGEAGKKCLYFIGEHSDGIITLITCGAIFDTVWTLNANRRWRTKRIKEELKRK